MCGILGCFGFNDKNLVRKAGDRMNHRGPDMHGSYSNRNIELFHRRLSIIDLSEKGKQPMLNENGDIAIVFNGEIYNFKELRENLKRKHKFHSDTDTEVIIHLYEEKGIDCLKDLQGDFAFAIWDDRRN